MKLEPNFSRLFAGAENANERKRRSNLYVFLVCLAISVFIWFLIALSKESYISLDYPIEFINAPADMVLVNQPDSVLSFRISSGGFELFTIRYLSARKPIVVDLENINIEKRDDFFTGVYNTSRLSGEVRKQYRFSENLVSISPENIYFKFELLSGKFVPVVSALKLDFQQQFRLVDSIVFEPAEVKVVGPRNLIDKIDRVKTTADLVSSIEGPVSSACDLEKPFANEQLVLVPSRVEYSLNAERFTETTLLIPVTSSRNDVIVKTFPEEVSITILVSLDNYKRVDPDLFTAVVELPAVQNEKSKAIVRLDKIPVFVEVTKIEPSEVDFLVIKQ